MIRKKCLSSCKEGATTYIQNLGKAYPNFHSESSHTYQYNQAIWRFYERKLALSDDILLSCEKPERYIGNEVNSVTKDLKDVKVRFAFCFPDVYEIGMSHLGIQILYGMFNSYDDVWCERVYSPWTDMDKVMRR